MSIGFVTDDGGRAAAGYKGTTGDCGCRAAAIVTGLPYQTVYDGLNALGAKERKGRRRTRKSSARDGVYAPTMRRYMASLGWAWTPTMAIGSGCTVHLRADELPPGRLLVCVSRHYVAVIDGVVHDLYNPDRGGSRCVYGYWSPPPEAPMSPMPAPPASPAALATARPWRLGVGNKKDVFAGKLNSPTVALTPPSRPESERRANAALIVRAVNAHGPLVAALQALLDDTPYAADATECECGDGYTKDCCHVLAHRALALAREEAT